MPHFPENVKEIFMDSGGFTFFSRAGDYEFSMEQYIAQAHKINADYVDVLDYPCEPAVQREPHETNYDRIERTIENATRLMELDSEINWVMVIQGYKVEEYLYCIDRIREQGLFTDLTAIGSVCIRKKIGEAREIIYQVRKAVPGWVKLHGFGVNLRFLRDNVIFYSLHSVDTGAWSMRMERGKRPWEDRRIYPSTKEERLECYRAYKRRVERLLEGKRKQTALSDG